MDSTQLERGTLEGKDRDELTTIANALGGKPGSRSRKAEIVDLILDLTGGGSNGSSTGPASSAAHEAAPEAAAEAAPEAGAADEEPPAEWEVAVAATADADESTPDTPASDAPGTDASTAAAGPSDDSGSEDGAQRSAGHRGGQGRSGQDRSQGRGQNQGRGHNQGRGQNQNQNQGQGQGRGQQGQQGQQGEQADAGNRRRRRRGRDREEGPEEVWEGEPVEISGYLDLRVEGYGFLRTGGYKASKDDAYLSVKQVRQFGLRKGDAIVGAARPANRTEKNPALLRIDSINGMDPEKAKTRPKFEDLTPLFPDEKLRMEIDGDPNNMTARIIDLLSPIGKGQRGMIVSPPKAGKTTIVKSIVKSIETNHPEVKLIVLLVDERPEEVTDMRRWTKQGEVVGSTFDRPSDEHTHLAEVVIERAKRMVEYGEDVVIVLDGITRLSRAYNQAAPSTGRVMSGGIDSGALYPPKRFFGAARNVEEGGSLTILATALVDTGSKMDEVIFEEFKGTGNMELRLDRRIAERRIYPAIDVDASSTRHEELLFERKQLNQVWKLRRVLNGLANDGGTGAAAGLELLIDRLKTFNNNEEFLVEIAKGPNMGA